MQIVYIRHDTTGNAMYDYGVDINQISDGWTPDVWHNTSGEHAGEMSRERITLKRRDDLDSQPDWFSKTNPAIIEGMARVTADYAACAIRRKTLDPRVCLPSLHITLHLSAAKNQFMRLSCNYLGPVLSADGVAVQPERVAALREWPIPTSTTDVHAFLGFCVYFRRHIKDFGDYAPPLPVLTAKTATLTWGLTKQQSFEALRHICCSPRVLATPRTGLPFQLRCDVSGFAAGCSLWQLHALPDGTSPWRPIEFRSKSFNTAERKKAAHERELLSFVAALKYFKPFLAGVFQCAHRFQ